MAGKADIVEAMANDTGLTRKDAAAALDSVVNAIAGKLKKGERVALPGLGTFHVADRKARAGINPRTKVARFHAGKDLKDLLNKRRK